MIILKPHMLITKKSNIIISLALFFFKLRSLKPRFTKGTLALDIDDGSLSPG